MAGGRGIQSRPGIWTLLYELVLRREARISGDHSNSWRDMGIFH